MGRYGAQQSLQLKAGDWEEMGWDGQKTGGGGLLQPLHALRRRVAVGRGRGRRRAGAFVRACALRSTCMHRPRHEGVPSGASKTLADACSGEIE